MKLAIVTLFAILAGLFSLGRAADIRSGRWAVAGVVLLVLAYTLDVLLRRIP